MCWSYSKIPICRHPQPDCICFVSIWQSHYLGHTGLELITTPFLNLLLLRLQAFNSTSSLSGILTLLPRNCQFFFSDLNSYKNLSQLIPDSHCGSRDLKPPVPLNCWEIFGKQPNGSVSSFPIMHTCQNSWAKGDWVAMVEEILIGAAGRKTCYLARGGCNNAVLTWASTSSGGTELWASTHVILQATIRLWASNLREIMRLKRNSTAGMLIRDRIQPQVMPFLMLLQLAATQKQHSCDEGLCNKALQMIFYRLKNESWREEPIFPPTLLLPGLK